MDILSLVSSLILIGGVLALVLYPLWQQNQLRYHNSLNSLAAAGTSPQTLEEVEVRYQATLQAIRDLMFDYEMEKVSPADYAQLFAQAKEEAARLRQQIDRLSQPAELDPALANELESMVAQVRQAPASLAPDQAVLQAIEAELSALKNSAPKAKANPNPVSTPYPCPNCAKIVAKSDAFCRHCGQSLPTSQDCPTCGTAFQPGDTFCTRCGRVLDPLAQPQTSEESR
jgi:hypothetical protein